MSWRPKGRQTLTSIHAENDDCNIFVILSMRIPTTTCILPFVGRWQGIEDTYARKGGICSWRFSRRWCLHELLQLFDERKRLASQTTQGLRGCFLTTNTMTYLVPEIDRIRGVEHMKEHVHEQTDSLGKEYCWRGWGWHRQQRQYMYSFIERQQGIHSRGEGQEMEYRTRLFFFFFPKTTTRDERKRAEYMKKSLSLQ